MSTHVRRQIGHPVYWTDRPWWTVEDAAKVLRINKHTLYRAVAADDFPHQRIGPYLRIPAEALHMRVLPQTRTRAYHVTDDAMQLELPLDPAALIPVRRYRNGELKQPWAYEHGLYAQRARSGWAVDMP